LDIGLRPSKHQPRRPTKRSDGKLV
jgi:hypothetical protein